MNSPRPRPQEGHYPGTASPETDERRVPLQIMVSASVRRRIALVCAERGESLRTTVLLGLRAIGKSVV